ncbi:MAG TPA: YibE/F family protein [Desulfosalsimonadaceae bacterium]|nr:YibE/F family protein [Desulfosalsimonadaceae bacterium]
MKFRIQDKKELLLSLLILVITIGLFLHAAHLYERSETPRIDKGKVIEITGEDLDGHTQIQSGYQALEVQMLSGRYTGEIIQGVNVLVYDLQFDTYLETGDPVSVVVEDSGKDTPSARVVNFHRRNILYGMAGIFVFLIVIIGRMKGFRSLVSLLFIIGLILAVLLPLILKGHSPVMVTVAVCAFGGFTALFLVTGLNYKAVVGSVGLLTGTVSSGLLAVICGNLMKLSGSDTGFEQLLVLYMPNKVDISGILYSGVIIACLGAVMDVSVELSSSLYELKRRNPGVTFAQLVDSGMNIGRDVMGTMANTLVLVYVGTSLAMFLYFFSQGFIYDYAIDLNLIASTFLQAVSGSIGLILAIPATVLFGAYFYTR